MRRHSYIIALASIFLGLSAVLYFAHYLIFRDAHHIFIYLLGDLAFLPLEVLLVVVVIERILARQERQAKLQKLNMVVGAFFSELGNRLLSDLIKDFDNRVEISQALNITGKWTSEDFRKAAEFARHLKVEVDYRRIDLEGLKIFLAGKREFLMGMLANSGLLEDDDFTDALWAVTHLDEELEARSSFATLPETDLKHISGDIARAYGRLAGEWLEYAEHLKSKYPYLFSLIVRTQPFQEHPSAIVLK